MWTLYISISNPSVLLFFLAQNIFASFQKSELSYNVDLASELLILYWNLWKTNRNTVMGFVPCFGDKKKKTLGSVKWPQHSDL